MTSNRPSRLLLAWSLLMMAMPAIANDTATTKPALVDATAVRLIDELGDPDPTVREAASTKLNQLGRAALPALNEAKEADDPEIRSRVQSLIRKAERRLPPAAPPTHPFGRRQSINISTVNGSKTIKVNDNGYRITIRQSPAGIVLDVTGVEDGKDVTEIYEAEDAETLKRDNPEAFALYERYNAQAAGTFVGVAGGGVMGVGGNRAVQRRMADHQIRAMEMMAAQLQQMAERVTPEHRARIQQQIQEMRERQVEMDQKLMQQLDALQKKRLDDLRVPEKDPPAEPEPAKKRE